VLARGDVIGAEPNGFGKLGHGLGQLSLLCQGRPQIVMGLSITGFAVYELSERGFRGCPSG
jgi:hypothetical protein